MSSSQELPKTHRALVLTSTSEPLSVQEIPTPREGPGSVVVRVLAAGILSYAGDIYNGTRRYPLVTPLVIGNSAIGRVAGLGPDTTSLKQNQLVLIDTFVRGRDDPNSAFLLGIHQGQTEGSKKLMHGEWRDATYAEYAKVPLENCHPLNEDILLGKLGYKIEDLLEIAKFAVPYGGISDIALKPGETVIVAPATGPFGEAAVRVALGVGAKVIAMGRNIEVLKRLKEERERVEFVQISGDMQADTEALKKFGSLDAFYDISPPAAEKSTHIKSAILALRHGGRVSLMGGIAGDISIPHHFVMHSDITLKGKWMYSRENVEELIKIVEMGMIPLGEAAGRGHTKFGLGEWKEAFDAAAKYSGTPMAAVLVP